MLVARVAARAAGVSRLSNSTRVRVLATKSSSNDSVDGGSGKKPHFLSREASEAPESYNRWLMVPPAVATHLCIGGLYAWSVLNEPLTRSLGVVTSSSGDWALASVIPVFSTAVCAAGAAGALTGKWADREGSRKSVFVAGTLWGGGTMLAGLGVEIQSLPLLYAGYGIVGGTGIGFAYSPPVATLLRWFPDRKGLASGMVIMGFGAGALVALPIIRSLIEYNFRPPTYLGLADKVATVVDSAGRRFLADDTTKEVVVASVTDITKLGLKAISLEPGVYVVGTGSSGVGMAMVELGIGYMAVMIGASLLYRLPKAGWAPPALSAAVEDKSKLAKTVVVADPLVLPPGNYVAASDAITTRQFAQVWTSLFLNATAGIAVLGVAKTLMSDVFGSNMPTTVDATFCAAYVGALSLSNGLGRLGWAAASDAIGRKKTFSLFFLIGAPLYLTVPVAAHMASPDAGILPLALFTTSTLAIISMYGGGFSISPAYLSDLFSNREVGNIYGKLLTAWSAAGLLGPTMLAFLRRRSEIDAMNELAPRIDPVTFKQQFGVSADNLQALIDNNVVSIAKLMQIAPPGTVDPSPYLYDTSMKTMAALLLVGFVNNATMQPVKQSLIRKI